MTKKILSCLLAAMLIVTTFSAIGFTASAEDITQDSQYRNIALRRATWHSTAADYNQTGHLVTDGLYEKSDESNNPEYTDQYGNSPSAEQPVKAFDKLSSTKWLTFLPSADASAWLQVKMPKDWLGNPAAKYTLTSANDSPNRDPKDWIIQGSNDGVNFVDLDKVEGYAWSNRQETRNFTIEGNETVYQYYRLLVLKNNGDIGADGNTQPRIQLGDFDLFDANGASLLQIPEVKFESFWKSKTAGEQYVYTDLGVESSINKVFISWGSVYATKYDIQISNDAKNWTTIKSVEDGKGDNVNIEFDTVETRYVRVLCKESNSNAYIINEVEVWGVNDLYYSVGEMPEPLEDGTQYLRGGNWKIIRADEVEANGETLSTSAFDDSEWLPATVPGTALTSYLNAGALPDPNFDDWQLQISDSYFTTNYWYRDSFVVPAEREGQKTWLNFDSINWKADIYLNGQYIDKIEGAFIRSKIDVTDYVKYGQENYLAVYIHMNDTPGSVTEQTLGSPGPNGGVLGADNPTIHASIGWDWVPTIRGRNVGIYDEVYLTYTDELQIRYPWAITDLDLGGEVEGKPVENIATKATATASSHETNDNDGVNVANKGNDGDMDTRWSSAYSDNQWYMLDFGEPTTFNGMRIYWEAAHSTDYVLQYSNDGKNFTDILSEPNCKGGKDTKVFDDVTARYFRVSMGGRITKYGHSFWEIEVYNTDPANIIPVIREPDFSKTDVTVKADVTNTFDEEVTAVVNGVITPGDIKFSKEITIPANTVQEVSIDGIVIENPELWWPNTYGDQFLYNCALTVSMNGKVSDQESFNFGVKEYSYSEGSPLQIYCNGTRISGRGGNWGMDDSNLAATDEDYDTKIRLHAEANLTMIRNWVGMTGNEAFYEACDKYGILVFDDFWLANPSDGPNPNDEDMFLTNAVDKIKRVRKYASLALYCGRNEGNPPESINNALKNYTKELDGTHTYIPHSASGTVSGFGPYAVQDPKWYFNNAPVTLHSERGLPNIPSIESIKAMLSEENQWPINSVWGLHDFTTGGAQNCNKFMQEMKDYGTYDSLESFTRIAQMVNYENHKALFEAVFNKRGNGMLMWMSQSAWPSFVWQTYDYFYDTNGGYFGLKAANQPVNAIWNCANDNIVLTNNTPNDYENLKVYVYMYDFNGKLIWSDSKTASIKSDSNEIVSKIAYPEGATDIKFIKTFVYADNGEKIAEDFYWTNSATYQDYAALNDLPYVDLNASYNALNKAGTTCFYNVKVENNSNTPALLIRVKTTNDLTGERVLPAYYEDNYFSLMPGESKEITVEFDESKLNGGNPVFEIEGWNVNAASIGEAGEEQSPILNVSGDMIKAVNAARAVYVTTNDTIENIAIFNEAGEEIAVDYVDVAAQDNGNKIFTVGFYLKGNAGEYPVKFVGTDASGAKYEYDAVLTATEIVYSASTDKEEYLVNDTVTFTVVTDKSVLGVAVANEADKFIANTGSSCVDNGDGTYTWTVTAPISTKGARTMSIYARGENGVLVDSGLDVSFIVDVAVSSGDDQVQVLSINSAQESVSADEVFTITVKTTTSATKVGIFSETGSALGKVSQSYVDKNGIRSWTIALKIGSKGERHFNVKATDRTGEWSEGKPLDITVY